MGLKGRKRVLPDELKAALELLNDTMDALISLSEEDIVLLVDNLCDYHRAIDSNVVIAREFIAPLLGPQGIIVLNSHHAASSELFAKEPSKLRVASPVSTWRGLGIGKCDTVMSFEWVSKWVSPCSCDDVCKKLFNFSGPAWQG